MRIDNAFAHMMERRRGSSKTTDPPRYDAADCHECVFLQHRSANASTYFRPFRDPGYSQRVIYYDHATPLLFMRICSVWVYRVQGEAEGDIRRGDKRYAVRILERHWQIRIVWIGGDVLVVAPTGMGKVCLVLRLLLLMFQKPN